MSRQKLKAVEVGLSHVNPFCLGSSSSAEILHTKEEEA